MDVRADSAVQALPLGAQLKAQLKVQVGPISDRVGRSGLDDEARKRRSDEARKRADLAWSGVGRGQAKSALLELRLLGKRRLGWRAQLEPPS